VYNRADCCQDLLSPFEVWVTEGPGDPLTWQAATRCGDAVSVAAGRGPFRVSCGGLRRRYVTLRLPGADRTLNIAELKIWGTLQAISSSPVVSPSTGRRSLRGTSADGGPLRRALQQEPSDAAPPAPPLPPGTEWQHLTTFTMGIDCTGEAFQPEAFAAWLSSRGEASPSAVKVHIGRFATEIVVQTLIHTLQLDDAAGWSDKLSQVAIDRFALSSAVGADVAWILQPETATRLAVASPPPPRPPPFGGLRESLSQDTYGALTIPPWLLIATAALAIGAGLTCAMRSHHAKVVMTAAPQPAPPSNPVQNTPPPTVKRNSSLPRHMIDMLASAGGSSEHVSYQTLGDAQKAGAAGVTKSVESISERSEHPDTASQRVTLREQELSQPSSQRASVSELSDVVTDAAAPAVPTPEGSARPISPTQEQV